MARLKRILVFDDDLPIRVLLSDSLREECADVSIAKDGRDSLNKLRNRREKVLNAL